MSYGYNTQRRRNSNRVKRITPTLKRRSLKPRTVKRISPGQKAQMGNFNAKRMKLLITLGFCNKDDKKVIEAIMSIYKSYRNSKIHYLYDTCLLIFNILIDNGIEWKSLIEETLRYLSTHPNKISSRPLPNRDFKTLYEVEKKLVDVFLEKGLLENVYAVLEVTANRNIIERRIVQYFVNHTDDPFNDDHIKKVKAARVLSQANQDLLEGSKYRY